ncbi:NAD-dependent epimerase/dehydratase family protein [Martelella mediterranea]|uniref:Putative epimerase/dehydratase n=1 Tax=Martelella mediterranea DSM 17316 TaxID=1122214 RepID=A0A1U9YWY5_9HYPH|nr:NAD(P)-dependent oxidoreductase [Martelella mediterranea]AQZ49948.1 putative epimerase/dehydratase [Martelella mediterranea DSM 17316]
MPHRESEAAREAGAEPVKPVSAQTVVITGGAGKIGRASRKHLAGMLKAIRVVDIVEPDDLAENESWHRVDICDPEAVRQALDGADSVVHLAGYPNERSIDEIFRVNVMGTHNIYEAARQTGVNRIVFGSSNHTVGFYPRSARISPQDAMRPDTFYGLGKCWSELQAGLYFERYGIQTLSIRIGNATAGIFDERSRVTWLGYRDFAELVRIGLEHPDIDCTTVFGVSKSDQTWWDNSNAQALGYCPQQDAETDAAPGPSRLAVTAFPEINDYFQGGRYCVIDHDGQVRRRRWP